MPGPVCCRSKSYSVIAGFWPDFGRTVGSVPLSSALLVVGSLLLLGLAAGVWLRLRDGRARTVRSADSVIDAAVLDPGLWGARATLVQFGTEFCTRCPQARRVLAAWADRHDGVRHREVDLTHRSDIASRYRIMQTPTTLVVDSSGTIRARIHGVPRPEALQEAWRAALGSTTPENASLTEGQAS